MFGGIKITPGSSIIEFEQPSPSSHTDVWYSIQRTGASEITFSSKLAVSGSVYPVSANTKNIGSSDKRWNNLYFNELYINGTQYTTQTSGTSGSSGSSGTS